MVVLVGWLTTTNIVIARQSSEWKPSSDMWKKTPVGRAGGELVKRREEGGLRRARSTKGKWWEAYVTSAAPHRPQQVNTALCQRGALGFHPAWVGSIRWAHWRLTWTSDAQLRGLRDVVATATWVGKGKRNPLRKIYAMTFRCRFGDGCLICVEDLINN